MQATLLVALAVWVAVVTVAGCGEACTKPASERSAADAANSGQRIFYRWGVPRRSVGRMVVWISSAKYQLDERAERSCEGSK